VGDSEECFREENFLRVKTGNYEAWATRTSSQLLYSSIRKTEKFVGGVIQKDHKKLNLDQAAKRERSAKKPKEGVWFRGAKGKTWDKYWGGRAKMEMP